MITAWAWKANKPWYINEVVYIYASGWNMDLLLLGCYLGNNAVQGDYCDTTPRQEGAFLPWNHPSQHMKQVHILDYLQNPREHQRLPWSLSHSHFHTHMTTRLLLTNIHWYQASLAIMPKRKSMKVSYSISPPLSRQQPIDVSKKYRNQQSPSLTTQQFQIQQERVLQARL